MTDFRQDGAEALEWAACYLERVGDLPVLAQVEPGDIRARLPAAPPEDPEPFSAVLRDLDEVLFPGITHWQSPRFFGFFPVSGSEPGILAELLIASLNQVAVNWQAAPASTELEGVVLDWVAQLLGLPSGWHGHIEDTASISTVAALAAARDATGGTSAVFSEHANVAVEKAARLVGLEPRKVPVDSEFRLGVGNLDLSGAAAVVATVGTTSTTAVDPVPALADACAEAGVWLHVDAAYAGAAWVCPELAWSREGVARADSVVVNAHKWLFTPMDCSLLWCRRPEDLRRAFSYWQDILHTGEDVALNLSDYGPALGRRFRALKLWAVLRCHGRSGLQRAIREHVRLASLFEGWVRDEQGWEVVAPRPFSVVCFRRDAPDEENEALLARVNASGEAFLSHTTLDGRYVLRLAVGQERTTEDDVRAAWEVLRREAARL
ncbi:MAG TPA: pyridoxal-dependent decarboxylase [Gaiellaceae bacterium]|nr:pyridoxal-dependent decarboxylase [Gaiellaceae bacterium]